jgi:hypothetical protein
VTENGVSKFVGEIRRLPSLGVAIIVENDPPPAVSTDKNSYG